MKFLLLLAFLGDFQLITAQHIQHDLPSRIDPDTYFMFYLHGGVVTVKGDNAINDPVPQFGPFEYREYWTRFGLMAFM